MFPAQRLDVIKQKLIEEKSVDITTLCTLLKVSDVTVRKYLDILEKDGFLIKMHGGAILANSAFVSIENEVNSEDTEEMENIGKLAATIVEDNDSIFIGPGLICAYIAKELKQYKNLTIVTNNANALMDLAVNCKNLYFLGGEVLEKDDSIYTHGEKTLEQLKGVFVKTAFISASGVDIQAGVTTNQSSMLAIYKKAIEISKNVVIVANHGKFDRIGIHHIGEISKFRIYVTGEKLVNSYKEYFYKNDIKILTSYNI